MLQDLRHALRRLARLPGFTAVAVLTLALGIGATTAVFGIVDAVLLRPLPYADPGRLVLVWQRAEGAPSQRLRVPGPDVVEYRARTKAFTDFAFVNATEDAVVGDGAEREHARIGFVSGNFFQVLGVAAQRGRVFGSGEGVLAPAPERDSTLRAPPGVVVLSDRVWRGRFGADTAMVGRSLAVNGRRVTVVGVLPPGFAMFAPEAAGLATPVDLWSPLPVELRDLRRPTGEWQDQDSDNSGLVIGRLRAGASLAQARAEMITVGARLRERVPQYARAGMTIHVESMHDEIVRDARPALLVLLGVVGMVLVVACLNIASLQVARAVGRRQEMAVRSALGAGRHRILRQAIVETGAIAAAGAVVGTVLASWGVGILLALGPADLPLVGAVGIDARVLAVVALTTVLATFVSGTVPALVLSRPSVTVLALHAVGRTVSDRSAGRARRILVVWQVALAFVLLTGSGLLVKSFARLHAIQPGFTAAHVLTFRVHLPGGSIGGPRERAEFMQRAVAEFEALPGVEAVGFVGGLPLGGAVWSQPYGIDRQDPNQWGAERADLRVASSVYFRAMGTRLLAGRAFTAREDVVEEERVAIVDAALARRVAPGGGLDDAVGKTIGFPLDGQPTWARIVGVVENVRQEDLRRQLRPTIYVPYRQEASRAIAVAVRASGDPQDLAAAIRQRFRALSAEEPVVVFGFRELDEYLREALAPSRFALTVVSALAGIALVLALIGLYGVQAYAVGRRVRDIGVRMAMGARPSQILQRELRTGLRLVAAGLALGLGLSYWAVRALGGLLYDIPPTDPSTYLVIALLMALATGTACYIPARRAARVHPMEALRDE